MGDCGLMGKMNTHPQGFMSRLARTQKGNVIALVAAAIIPLAALIGGGLDMGRAYMARARMQQACDAAALAGRRAMTTSSMTQANKDEAKKFFDFNFPQGTFQAATFTPVIRSKPGETTTVQVTASTTMPTTVMKIFRYETLPLSVTCEARFDIGNTDVMLCSIPPGRWPMPFPTARAARRRGLPRSSRRSRISTTRWARDRTARGASVMGSCPIVRRSMSAISCRPTIWSAVSAARHGIIRRGGC
jgi:Flp pilus assembly protein TadG